MILLIKVIFNNKVKNIGKIFIYNYVYLFIIIKNIISYYIQGVHIILKEYI
jgi:hypothetical protein